MGVHLLFRPTRPGLRLRPTRPSWQAYVLSVGFTAAAIAVRASLDPVWGREHNRHLVFLPTVMLAAWLGGFGPGVVSVAMSAVALDYFWTEPLYRLHFPIASDLLLYVILGLAVSWLIESLRKARSRADAATNAREHVLAIVAHDLRNPLSTLRVALSLLRKTPSDGTTLVHRLETMDRAAEGMERLISDLVDATHAERGSLTMNFQEEGVQAMLQELHDAFSARAHQRRIELSVQSPPTEVIVHVDRTRLMQVFGNLLSNALAATPPGGNITIRCDVQDSRVVFAVEDSGRGIEPEALPHIFERYWNTGEGGTGLGLFIAQSIVRAHGASIDVRSRLGHGTTFFFAAPRSKAYSRMAFAQSKYV